jgi:hypothetical protein
MTSSLREIQAILENNCQNIKDGDYLKVCNLLMKLHSDMEFPIHHMMTTEYSSTIPLPDVDFGMVQNNYYTSILKKLFRFFIA